jgi:hypothetical protein
VDRSSSNTTAVPLETEFLTDYDFTQMVGNDPIDWDSLLNVGDMWRNFGGGWSDPAVDGQSLN